MPRTHKTIVAVALALLLGGCTATDGPTPSETDPHITLSTPPTMTAGAVAHVVIDSAGHDGEQVKLYGFPVEFDAAPDCTSGTVFPVTVTLTGGHQAVTLSPFPTGADVYWMIAGTGFTTSCGEAKTRILDVPRIFIFEFDDAAGDPAVQVPAINQATVTIDLTQIDQYMMSARVRDIMKGQPLTVTATWVGPFRTAPEVHADPCPTTPVAASDTFTFDWTESGSMGSQTDEIGVDSTNSLPVESPGVYRLLLSVPATAYSAEIVPVCSSSMIVTAQ